MLKLSSRHTDVNRLSAGCFQLSFCFLNEHFGDESSLVEGIVQIQRILVLDDGILQKLFFGVQTASCEVIDSQVGMHAEIDGREIGSAGLRLSAVGLDGPTDAAPDVSLVTQFERQDKIVEGNAI